MIGFTTPSVLSSYTVANLINSLPPNSGITYADVLALLLNPGDLSWENLDLTGTPIQNFSTGGSTLGYQADFHLAPNGGPAGVPNTATLDVEPPAGLRLPAGQHPASDQRASRPPNQPGNPTVLADGTLALDGQRQRRHELQPPVHDPAWADARTDGGDGEDHAWQAASSRLRRRPPPVTVGDTLEPNDTPGDGAADLDRSGTAPATRSTSRT